MIQGGIHFFAGWNHLHRFFQNPVILRKTANSNFYEVDLIYVKMVEKFLLLPKNLLIYYEKGGSSIAPCSTT